MISFDLFIFYQINFKEKINYGWNNTEKLFKQVAEQSLDEAITIIQQDSTKDKAEYCTHTKKLWNKKIAAIKTLEEEIIDSENDPGILETVIHEGTQFKFTAKAKTNSINKFLSEAFPSKTKAKEQSHDRNGTAELSKIELSKLHGDPKVWQEFIEFFNAGSQFKI